MCAGSELWLAPGEGQPLPPAARKLLWTLPPVVTWATGGFLASLERARQDLGSAQSGPVDLVSKAEAVLRGLGLAPREEAMFPREHLSCSVISEHTPH